MYTNTHIFLCFTSILFDELYLYLNIRFLFIIYLVSISKKYISKATTLIHFLNLFFPFIYKLLFFCFFVFFCFFPEKVFKVVLVDWCLNHMIEYVRFFSLKYFLVSPEKINIRSDKTGTILIMF